MMRLRLLKVTVQPVFVVDDGETLTERVGQPVEVTAANWPGFAASAFAPDEMAEMQAHLTTEDDPA